MTPSDLPQASAKTSEADADHEGGTASPEDQQIAGLGDDRLPEDLRPTEDNPLAQPLDPDDESTKDPDELGMRDTQADTGGTYESSGETPSAETPSKPEVDKPDEEYDDGPG